MNELELRLRLATVPVDFDRFVQRVTDEIDDSAIVSTHDGISFVNLSVESSAKVPDVVSIALGITTEIEKLGATVDDIDDDLVDLSEIAERIGRSRETVRLWSLGRRGNGEFPLPTGLLPGSLKVWEWDAVNSWLAKHHPDLAEDVCLLSRIGRAKYRIKRAKTSNIGLRNIA